MKYCEIFKNILRVLEFQENLLLLEQFSVRQLLKNERLCLKIWQKERAFKQTASNLMIKFLKMHLKPVQNMEFHA